MDTAFILLSAFVLSFVALLVFIWSQSHGLFDRRASGAEIIFASGEIGQVEEPAASLQQQGQLQSAMNAVKAPPASQADAQASIPESIDISEHGEKKHYPTMVDMRKQQVDFYSAEPENLFKQEAENNLIADEEHNLELPEAAGKTPNVNGNKALMNHGLVIRELAAETVFGHKPSKVTASHIEDIQKTIEMQIEKTPVLGTTIVKILLTPDNIGDIHVQLIKTKDSITAVLHVQDAETKGLLEDQLPLLMEPFKHSVSESPLTLTVVADPSLAFSFSEGADPGHRKMERQESRKRTSKEKTETKKNPTTKQSSRGLSVLA